MLNALVEFDEVPSLLKAGIIIPVCKRHGRDPLKMNSYRGVTLSSVIAKLHCRSH